MHSKWIAVFFLSVFGLFANDFVLFTQPKTGTHLLTPILSELTGKAPYCPREYIKGNSLRKQNGSCKVLESGGYCPDWVVEDIWQTNERQRSFLHFHTPYTKELERYLQAKGATVFFVKRDPRDQIVSLLNHYKLFRFLNKKVEQLKTDEERLLYMIRHHLKRSCERFKGWLSSPICTVLEFSKLMGSHGGAATDEEALAELRKISSSLGMDRSDEYLQYLYSKHFGNSGAFFRGKVGSWRDYFSDSHKKAAKEEVGQLLIELGFEKDLNW